MGARWPEGWAGLSKELNAFASGNRINNLLLTIAGT
jgi:hypothetical protein